MRCGSFGPDATGGASDVGRVGTFGTQALRLSYGGFAADVLLLEAVRELCPGFDVQLAERLAQVLLDGPGADEELGGDLLIGGPLCRQTGDEGFLRCQVVAGLDVPFAGVLAGSA